METNKWYLLSCFALHVIYSYLCFAIVTFAHLLELMELGVTHEYRGAELYSFTMGEGVLRWVILMPESVSIRKQSQFRL